MTLNDIIKHNNITKPQRDNLIRFVNMLEQWNKHVNLIANSTTNNIWKRHVQDSSALLPYINNAIDTIADIGSGAGFPGIIIAILAQNPITLIESLSRKTAFLQEVKNQLGLDYNIINDRIENIPKGDNYNIITARAVADLSTLWGWSTTLRNQKTKGLFLKGEKADEEFITMTQKYPEFILNKHDNPYSLGYIISVQHKKHHQRKNNGGG